MLNMLQLVLVIAEIEGELAQLVFTLLPAECAASEQQSLGYRGSICQIPPVMHAVSSSADSTCMRSCCLMANSIWPTWQLLAVL